MLEENIPKIIPQILQNRILQTHTWKSLCFRERVYVSEKSEVEVEIQLHVMNNFGFIVVILVGSTGSSRPVTLWDILFS